MAEPSWDELVTLYHTTMTKKFGSTVADAFKDSLCDLFEELEYLQEDMEFEPSDWQESALMDDLNGKNEFSDDEFCKSFFAILKQVVRDGESYDDTRLPSDMDWNVTDHDLVNAQKYMHKQCPGGVFAHPDENRALYRTVAVGRKNEIELLSVIMEIYELSHIDNIVRKKRKFSPSEWKTDCKFLTKDKERGNMLIRAIEEFKKRIAGGGPAEMVLNPIQDDINVYVGYTLMMSKVVAKVIEGANNQKKSVCPFQLDLIICGRRQKEENSDQKEDDDDDDDDDDELDIGSLSMSMGSFVKMNNQVPADGIAKLLERGKIKYEMIEGVGVDKQKSVRALNEALAKSIDDSHKRIVVLIDRSEADKEDSVYIYQTGNPQHDVIEKEFEGNELHMSWKTKTATLPNWKNPDNEMQPFVGAQMDFGDNSFVFSFHVHSEDYVKCDQWIKAQKSPFLPYHIYSVWPMYFSANSRKLDDKYQLKDIYQEWGLPVHDNKISKWIQTIDPKFYKVLSQYHLANFK